jgi:hypothetical protein
MNKDTWTRGASNSQGPGSRPKDWQQHLLSEAQTDAWKLQGHAS